MVFTFNLTILLHGIDQQEIKFVKMPYTGMILFSMFSTVVVYYLNAERVSNVKLFLMFFPENQKFFSNFYYSEPA